MNRTELLKAMVEIRDYWANINAPDIETAKDRIDGAIFSILCLFDGVSSINDFMPIKLVEGNATITTVGGHVINSGCSELHADYSNYR